MTVRIPYSPHPGQRQIHEALRTHRFVTVCAGRRFGKSEVSLNHSLRTALSRPESEVRFASPVYGQAKARFRRLMQILRDLDPALVSRVHRGDLRFEFANGSSIAFWSTAEPDNLRGEGVDLIILDEAGYVAAEVWHQVLRPMLADTGGQALAVGTPRGRGQLLHQLWLRGETRTPGWASFRFPTSANPRIPAEEIDAARAEFPEDAFRQEFLAEFLDSAAGVFRNVAGCIGGELEGPRPGRRYVTGVDLAASVDWSCLATVDVATGQLVAFDRFRGNYMDQIPRILETARRFNDALLVVDETGVGRPVLDAIRMILGRSRDPDDVPRAGGIRRQRSDVLGVVLTSERKQDLVQGLALAIERKRVRIPASCRELLGELELYGYELLASGRVRYSAPAGHHDDAVVALALAVHAIPRAARSAPEYRDAHLIESLCERVSRPGRYGVPGYGSKALGLTVYEPGGVDGDLISEMRLLQLSREAGLVAEDEIEFLAKDLRRRMREVRLPFYTDSLDERFGTLDDFLDAGRNEAALITDANASLEPR